MLGRSQPTLAILNLGSERRICCTSTPAMQGAGVNTNLWLAGMLYSVTTVLAPQQGMRPAGGQLHAPPPAGFGLPNSKAEEVPAASAKQLPATLLNCLAVRTACTGAATCWFAWSSLGVCLLAILGAISIGKQVVGARGMVWLGSTLYCLPAA